MGTLLERLTSKGCIVEIGFDSVAITHKITGEMMGFDTVCDAYEWAYKMGRL